ncbi:MAG: hypothetical protein KA436_00620 [Oligoflexales bacterium]|nr:hypothetical protein [Oligoflexales bacterium]
MDQLDHHPGAYPSHFSSDIFKSEEGKHKLAVFIHTLRSEYKLSVYRGQEGYKPIPAAFTPLTVQEKTWMLIHKDSQHILSAMHKYALYLTKQEHKKIAELLYNELSALEQEAAYSKTRSRLGVATARLDLFFEGEELKVIEANTSIPAMQAYSDMIVQSYLAIAPISSEFNKTPRNSLELLQSLLSHYEKAGGQKKKPSVAIVSRVQDSQQAELKYLQKIWQSEGHECFLLHPEQIKISEDGKTLVFEQSSAKLGKKESFSDRSITIDLVYRHIFASKLDPNSDFAKACLQSEVFHIFNPISGHMEGKGFLAELLRSASDPHMVNEIQLNADEERALSERCIWTRPLLNREEKLPDGSFVKNLSDWVKANRDHLVLKKHISYGGQDIFLGKEFHSPASQEKAAAWLGLSAPISWSQLVDACTSGCFGLWVVQVRLQGKQTKVSYIDPKGEPIWDQPCYIDASIFCNHGADFHLQGGVSRFAPGAIVNIVQGGGLLPFLVS